MNPYRGVDFFQFFALFFSRIFSGKPFVSDEIQIFVLSLIAIAASLVGTLLVLKRMTMLANSLSHTILLGIVVAYLLLFKGAAGIAINFQVLLIAALITGILTTLLTQLLHRVIKLQEDASIGLVFTTLFALGIILVTLFTRNAHIGIEVVMGNADALHVDDLKISFGIALANFTCIFLLFKEWKIFCFDEGLASSLGYRLSFFQYLLMLLTSATAIGAFRAVGVMLFLALLVGPPLTARLLTSNFQKILWLSCGIGILSVFFSVALARHLLSLYQISLSTAGLVVAFIGLFFFLAIPLRHLTFSKIWR